MHRQAPHVDIPARGDVELDLDGRAVRLTNLDKVFWPRDGRTKGDVLRYYCCSGRTTAASTTWASRRTFREASGLCSPSVSSN